ncbi:ABC transporter permease [Streptomyces vilmorinianum]|uniref:ABC transporter permease n=1 Tax=Streptomyces vilmorinianum TaxID=3051092 RepID=UPI0010FB279E|nr:ABC transporter permease [Streptomyces vilmorinianum]
MSALALKGPYWVTVRQHKPALTFAAVAVTLGLATMLWLRHWDSRTVGTNQDNGYAVLRIAMDWASTGIFLVPLLVGAYLAGPMLARELESGTYKLALTQSVPPARWLGSKLLVAGAVTVAATLVMIGTFRLGWGNVAGTYQFLWHDRGVYEATGPVLVAHSLLALALGALLGQLIRRTVVAMAVTGLATGTLMLLVGALRWSLMPVTTGTVSYAQHGGVVAITPASARETASGLISETGERFPTWICHQRTPEGICPSDMRIVSQYADYHPASHYWPLQLIETGIVLALAALALLAAFRVLRARHA